MNRAKTFIFIDGFWDEISFFFREMFFKIADNDIQRSESGVQSKVALTCEGQAFPPPDFR